MSYLHVVLMAIVQGLTEFLPVSSKAHLSLTDAVLALIYGAGVSRETALLATIVMLHLGTLVALFVVFWRRILRLLSVDRALLVKLLLATIPGGAVGLTVHELWP